MVLQLRLVPSLEPQIRSPADLRILLRGHFADYVYTQDIALAAQQREQHQVFLLASDLVHFLEPQIRPRISDSNLRFEAGHEQHQEFLLCFPPKRAKT